jgi:hypothetical protein
MTKRVCKPYFCHTCLVKTVSLPAGEFRVLQVWFEHLQLQVTAVAAATSAWGCFVHGAMGALRSVEAALFFYK